MRPIREETSLQTKEVVYAHPCSKRLPRTHTFWSCLPIWSKVILNVHVKTSTSTESSTRRTRRRSILNPQKDKIHRVTEAREEENKTSCVPWLVEFFFFLLRIFGSVDTSRRVTALSSFFFWYFWKIRLLRTGRNGLFWIKAWRLCRHVVIGSFYSLFIHVNSKVDSLARLILTHLKKCKHSYCIHPLTVCVALTGDKKNCTLGKTLAVN